MRVLLVDPLANGLDLVLRGQRDGHVMRLFVRDTAKTEHVGKGFCEVHRRFEDLPRLLDWADLVVNCDNTFYLREIDGHRNRGGAVISASSETAEWELDRSVGMKIFAEHDIEVPRWKEFSDYDQAVSFVKRHNKAFVSKPSGEADKALSYVSKGPADMVFMLERWKSLGKLKAPFILQERILGMEMAVGGWMGRDGFVGPWCENFEFKKLCNGDLGCATGEQGTVLRYISTSKLANRMLKPLEAKLIKAGYVGYIDVNTMIDEDGTPWPLEFTMRFGWPTTPIQLPLHHGDYMSWLKSLCSDEPQLPRIDERTIAIGVVLTIPDYPYSHITRKEVVGIPVYGITSQIKDHIHPGEMMIGKAPIESANGLRTETMWVTAGDYVLVMTATGETVQQAAKTSYRRLKHLEIPNSPMYRTDIGARLKTHLPKLQAMGYARGMSYSMPP